MRQLRNLSIKSRQLVRGSWFVGACRGGSVLDEEPFLTPGDMVPRDHAPDAKKGPGGIDGVFSELLIDQQQHTWRKL